MVMVIGVAALGPPSPMAVTEVVNVPAAVGDPVMAPVVAFSDRPAGSPVAVQLVAGRFEESVRVTNSPNGIPIPPVKDWPDVIIGVPAEMTNVTGTDELVSFGPSAIIIGEKVP